MVPRVGKRRKLRLTASTPLLTGALSTDCVSLGAEPECVAPCRTLYYGCDSSLSGHSPVVWMCLAETLRPLERPTPARELGSLASSLVRSHEIPGMAKDRLMIDIDVFGIHKATFCFALFVPAENRCPHHHTHHAVPIHAADNVRICPFGCICLPITPVITAYRLNIPRCCARHTQASQAHTT